MLNALLLAFGRGNNLNFGNIVSNCSLRSLSVFPKQCKFLYCPSTLLNNELQVEKRALVVRAGRALTGSEVCEMHPYLNKTISSYLDGATGRQEACGGLSAKHPATWSMLR